MSGIGHNGGPTLEPGTAFRRLAWKKARKALLPSLPLEVVRVRVARAKRLGLPYQAYATIRATAGQDIVAFLFSGNALGLTPSNARIGDDLAPRLRDLDGAAQRLSAIYAPHAPRAILAANAGLLEAAAAAPDILTPWREARDRLRGLAHAEGVRPDGVVLVAATALEHAWCGTAGFAGSLSPEVFAQGLDG